MKKKIILVITILVVLVTLICIPKSTYQKWFGNDQIIEEQPSFNDFLTVYVVNEQNKLVGVKVFLEEVEEDTISQKWNILTSNINLIPNGYSSSICPTTTLNSYEIIDNKLVINVSEEIFKSSGRLTIESLAWTFCDKEINEIILKVDGQVINTINDCNFEKISKDLGTNFVYETAYLFESNYTTIVFYQDDFILPVTYFYKDINESDFMVNKIFKNYDLEVGNFNYEISNECFSLILEDNLTINENLKNTLLETVDLNLDVESIIVSNKDNTLLEETFAKVN